MKADETLRIVNRELERRLEKASERESELLAQCKDLRIERDEARKRADRALGMLDPVHKIRGPRPESAVMVRVCMDHPRQGLVSAMVEVSEMDLYMNRPGGCLLVRAATEAAYSCAQRFV